MRKDYILSRRFHPQRPSEAPSPSKDKKDKGPYAVFYNKTYGPLSDFSKTLLSILFFSSAA